MKEPILEFLECAESDYLGGIFRKHENIRDFMTIKQDLKRKLLLHGLKSRFTGMHLNKIHKRQS